MKKAHDWFRDKTQETELSQAGRVVKFFPEGPHHVMSDLIDVVVVTPDGTS